jgi:DNA invertase Pin-like site-specific DNA recombinase
MDRLTRGIKDFVGLHDQAQAERWALVMLDVDLDTSTPTGEFTANIRASASQFERRLIGQRTREALAQKRAQGIRLGRPPEIDPATEELIVSWRRAGLPLRTIAEELNAADFSRAAGGTAWHVSTVRRVLGRHDVPAFRPGRRPRAS